MRKFLLLVLISTSSFLFSQSTCTPVATPFFENFDTWPLSCWDTIGGTEYWQQYTGTSGNNYAVADFWNVSLGDYQLRSRPVLINAASQVRFSWSHLSSASYPDDQLVILSKTLNSTVWDTLINLKAGDGNFNDPTAGNTSPGSFIESIILLPASYVGDTIEVSVLGVSGFGPNVYLNDFYVEDVPPCPAPMALTLNGTTSNSATFSFISPGSQWFYEWGPVGFQQGTGNTDTAFTNPFTLTGLTPQSTYDIYIRNECQAAGNGVSSFAGPLRFSTSCITVNAPFYESFDNWPLSCWDTTGGTNYWQEYVGATNDHYAMANFWSVSNGNYKLKTPPIALTAQSQVRFSWSHLASSSYPNDELLILSKPVSSASWDTVFYFKTSDGNFNDPTAGNTSPGNFIESVSLLPASYIGDTVEVQVIGTSGFGPYVFLNDFYVEDAPLCPPPYFLSTTSVTSTSATFTFNSSGSSWIYEWGPIGFQQGTGTIDTAYTNPFTITGLASQNSYDIYIRTNCVAAGNGLSNFSGPLSFFTACNVLSTPYYESFDAWPLSCWDSTGGSEYWKPVTGSGTDRYAEADFWSVSLGDYHLKTPPIAISTQPQVRFSWSHLASSSYPDDQLLILSKPVSSVSWDTIIDLKAVNGNFNDPSAGNTSPGSFIETIGILPASYIGDTIEVKIVGVSDFGPNAYVNNFYVEDAPLCVPTSLNNITLGAVTGDSAYLYWNPGAGVNWKVEIGSPGFIPGTGAGIDSVNVIDTTAGFGGLTPNTTYHIYLRDTCAGGFLSPYTGPFVFTTLCTTFSMPYYQSLDIWPVSCWDSTGGSIDWEKYTGMSGDNYAMADFWGNSSGDMVLTSPIVNLGIDAQIRFYWSHLYSSSYPNDELIVRVKLATGTVWDTVLTLQGGTDFNDPSAGNTTPGNFIEEEIVLNPTIYTGNDIIVEFVGITGFGPSLFLNDIYIEAAPTCPKPFIPSVSALTPTSATLNWQASSNASTFQVWYGPAGFFQGTNSAAGIRTAQVSNNYTLTGLTPNTCYEFVVRAYCTPGDTSTWTAMPVSFCTPCPVLNAPFIEDFENHSVGHYMGADNCWDFNSNNPGFSPSGGFSWEVRNTPQTTSTNTGPAGDNTLYPGIGGNWIHSDNSGGTTGDSTLLVSPLVNIAGLANPELEYHFHNYAAPTSIYRQPLYVDVFDGVTWHNKVHEIDYVFQLAATDPWKDTIIDLTPFNANGMVQVRFRTKITRSAGGAGDVAIDDIRISDPAACPVPDTLGVSNIGCSNADLEWTGIANATSIVEYGVAGFAPGTGAGTIVMGQSPLTVTGLLPNTNYEFYVADTCAMDTSMVAGPYAFTTTNSASASFTSVINNATPTGLTVDFDASASSGASSYTWDFGDTSALGSGMLVTHIYTYNGVFDAKLIIDGPCGKDSIIQTVIIQGIGQTENELAQSLQIYPNPAHNLLEVTFVPAKSKEAVISILDLSGKLIMKMDFKEIEIPFKKRLDISSLAKGTYMLQIESAELKAVRRIVKQ